MTTSLPRQRRNLERARAERVVLENRRRREALERRQAAATGPDAPAGGSSGSTAGAFPQGCGNTAAAARTGTGASIQRPTAARAAVCRAADGRGWLVSLEISGSGGAQRRNLPGQFGTLAAAMAAAYGAAASAGLPVDGIGWG